ncbi:DsbA family protein [Kitasatospora sp. NPDC059812]|uniref:DsbA family oxidoreductase n=1 Tax=Kitasatospora sp. NPDC059812 TaxID=3346958 RepID=UPI003656A2BD
MDCARIRGCLWAQRLDDPALDRAVGEDEELGERLGLRGVPLFVLGGRVAINGAVEVERLADALEQRATRPEAGAVCEEGACSQ